MNFLRALMITTLHCIPQCNTNTWYCCRISGNCPVATKSKRRIKQGINSCINLTAFRNAKHEIGHQLQIPCTLLDALNARQFFHETNEQCRAEIVPWNDVIDNDRHIRRLGECFEVCKCCFFIWLENVMDRCHLKSLDRQVRNCFCPTDCITC